jgi:hypothetical protein
MTWAQRLERVFGIEIKTCTCARNIPDHDQGAGYSFFVRAISPRLIAARKSGTHREITSARART